MHTILQIKWRIQPNKIFVYFKGKLCDLVPKNFTAVILVAFHLLTAAETEAQQKITGKVFRESNLPLYGATIKIRNSDIAAISEADGSFVINARTGDLLEISFIGYKTGQIKIGDEINYNINLIPAIISLDDIVMTGYTSQKIKAITGSVAVVQPKELTSIPAGQVEQMLQGRVAGLTVITTGLPGSPSIVRIHGVGNFGDVKPLYLIDGVEGDINNLNANDIESLQVLKDAGAYAIYGVRGANGVLVITTRKGRQGKTRINYDFYIGTTRPLNVDLGLLNPQEMADLTWTAYRNLGQTPSNPLYGTDIKPVLPDFFIAGRNVGLPAGDPDTDPSLYNSDFANGEIYQIVKANKSGTDWFHELYKPALIQHHSLQVSGANEKNKYAFTLGYMDQQGTLTSTWLKRFSVRMNSEFNVANTFRVGENLQWTYRDQGGIPDYGSPNDNDMWRSITTNPILPVYDIKGGWAHLDQFHFWDNPVALRVQAGDDKSNSWETFGNIYGELDFLKNFTARTSFGGTINNYNNNRFDYWSYEPLIIDKDSFPDNALSESSGYRWSWTWTNTIKYAKTVADHHQFVVLAGTEAINNYNKEIGGRSAGLYVNDVNYRFLTNGTPSTAFNVRSNYSFADQSSLFSFFTQFDYGYKDKYYFRGTLRNDGASVFGEENRYGWFPSVSAAWRISQENFMVDSKWIDELKIRASWGKTGFYGNVNSSNQYTLYGSSIGNSYYDINGVNSPSQGFRATRFGDPNTGWQEDVVTNIGVESVFWNGKLNLTIDWYNKKANGLLFEAGLPDILGGAVAPAKNVGVIQNKGFDILLGSKGSWNRDWKWDLTTTASIYKNKILKVSDQPFFFPIQGERFVKNQVGHAVSSYFGYKIIGIFADSNEVKNAPEQDEAKPGRFRYLDANGDNDISGDDRVFLGDANPDFTLGLNIGIGFRNFDFSTFFYGSFGNEVVNSPKTRTDFFGLEQNSAKSRRLLYESWTPQNIQASTPIAEASVNFSNIAVFNSYIVEDGSYFRNKSVILGYTFPVESLKRFKVEKLRIYIQAVNLFTITDYSGIDPELAGNSAAFGIDYGNYPNSEKRFLFGVNLGF